MPAWVRLGTQHKSVNDEPWNLYWSEMKSGTPEFEEFLHDPLTTLCRDLAECDESWTVQTIVLNHEATLSNNIVCQVAFVDPPKKLVYLTVYKHQS